jgi:iron complex transport system substrate-binding protein
MEDDMVQAGEWLRNAERASVTRIRRWSIRAVACAVVLTSVTLVGIGSGGVAAQASAPQPTGLPPSMPNGDYPVTISDCGITTTYTHAPTRVVTIEESSTEFMLALGLQKSMVGTAYIDSPILPAFKAAYDKIPVLSPSSVSEEKVLAKQPDFVYAAYGDQFSSSGGSGTRQSLQNAGVDTYLSPSDCLSSSPGDHQVSFDTVWSEIQDLGEIFGVENRANALIDSQQKELKAVTAHGEPFKGLKVFWYDSDTTPPYVGACCGVPELLMKTLGATNIFVNAPGGWANGNWETVASSKPNVIVFDDAVWDTTSHKEKFLAKNSATKNLSAVKNHEYISIPFAYITPSDRNVSALQILADDLKKLNLSST